MMTLRKDDTEAAQVVKVLLGQWGRLRRTGWRLQGLNFGRSSVVFMSEATPIRLPNDDPDLMQFARAMIALKSISHPQFMALRLTYEDEQGATRIARRYGVTPRAIQRRIQRAIFWLEQNWQSADFELDQ
jgi:DNA-directed RNA polymerase specialized sigma24 family protein